MTYKGSEEPLLPPLKWAGGKRWLVPRLLELYAPHRHRRLVEPFVGGMSVALGLNPDTALLADVNQHLVNFYRRLQNPKPFSIEMKYDEALYYKTRDEFNAGDPRSDENAERFYYLNRTGFNGLCRFNRLGEFNVAFGRHKIADYTRGFSRYAAVLGRWEIWRADFRSLLPHIGPDDWLYADPPYDDGFVSYTEGGFSWDMQVQLAQILTVHPGPVVASNKATDRIMELYVGLGFEIEVIDAPRRISCSGDRTPAKEMLATRNR